MPDHIYFSLWIEGYSVLNMLRHFGKLLERFPFSRQRPPIRTVRIYAMELAEPPLAEYVIGENESLATTMDRIGELMGADCCCEVEGYWDLWDLGGGGRLEPIPVRLYCFGPRFDNPEGDHLRVEVGHDGHFLAVGSGVESRRKAQSNLKGLLRFVRDAERVLPVHRKRVWMDSGTNLAELVRGQLEEESGKGWDGDPDQGADM